MAVAPDYGRGCSDHEHELTSAVPGHRRRRAGVAAFVAHNAGFFVREAGLIGAKTAIEVKATSMTSPGARMWRTRLWRCSAPLRRRCTPRETLPGELTDWRDFVAARAGVTTDSQDYFGGKLAQLGTA
jgi:hypothetical protein